MMYRSNLLLLILAGVFHSSAMGQTQLIQEQPKTGECFRYAIETQVKGGLKIAREGKTITIPLQVVNQHAILEKVIAEGKGTSRKVVRHYVQAQSKADLNQEKIEKTLRADRRLIVAQRMDDPLFCYSPAGPLLRSELEVVAEHFDTLHLTGLLPGKEVSMNDTWKIPNATVQTLCLFEGLLSQELTGKLSEIRDGNALIEISGKANGIELGAMVNLEIKASVQFDLLTKRLVSIEWSQKDTRDQGPISPASEVESKTILKREFLKDEPAELSLTAIASVPSEDNPTELLKLLSHTDHRGRYRFLHGREWHIVGQTDNHLVIRLLERGDFIAQANLTWWKNAGKGQHMTIDELKKVIAQSPGWELEEIVDSAEIPTEKGRWLYRITAKGDLDGIKVMQNYYCLANEAGDQMIVTFTMKPTHVSKIGTRDVQLVNSIEMLVK